MEEREADMVWHLAPNVGVASVLIVEFLLLFLYDAIALLFWGHEYTVSYVLQSWSKHYPVLPLVIGILMGHLFWPVRPEQVATPIESLQNGQMLAKLEAELKKMSEQS